MNKLEQAARQALNYLENSHARFYEEREKAITALRETLAEPKKPEECANGCPQLQVCDYCQIAEQAEQEPVAKVLEGGYEVLVFDRLPEETPLYAAPVRTKDLTDDEIWGIADKLNRHLPAFHNEFARAVIAADREKNKCQ